MWSFVIKGLPPHIHCLLIGLGQGFNFPTYVQMHPLMGAVVLWVTRPAALQLDTQSYPPGRQATQSQRPWTLAKGDPLSLRMAWGKPARSKSRSKLWRTLSLRALSIARNSST